MAPEQIEAFALTVGMTAVACRDCRARRVRCPECGGSGRLWISGAAVLNDAGMAMLANQMRRAHPV